jgi:hypothetical protein
LDPASPPTAAEQSPGDSGTPAPADPQPDPAAPASAAAAPPVVAPAPVPAGIAALPPLESPLGILGGYAPTIVRGTASTRSAMVTGLVPLFSAPRRQDGVAILLAGPEPGSPPNVSAPNGYDPAPDFQQPASPTSASAASAKEHPTKPAPVGNAGDERSPRSPSAPPGRGVVAGSASASGGGGATAMWCAVLIGLLAVTARELRRHRFRLVLWGPVGVVSPQQRPG